MAALGMTAFAHNMRAHLVAACMLAFALAASAVAPPSLAFAYYYDYDTANVAQQEIDTSGDPIPGGAIPDGVYLVGARTSSRMCILYPTAEDCANNTNREMCYISVEGGNITAVFYISKAYTRLCMGTGEYAASLSDASGTNDAPYMVGDPADGYVPHLYTFPVNALNESIVFAAFSGGNRSIEEAKWYTRTVAFTPTEDVMRAIKGETRTPDPEPEPAQDESSEAAPAAEDDQSQSQAAAAGAAGNPDDGSGGTGGTTANENVADNAAENAAVEETPAEQQEEASEPAQAQTAATPAKKHGIPVTIAELGVPDFVIDVQQVEAVDTGPKGLTQAQALGLLLAAGIVAGGLMRVVTFVRSKRRRV